MQISALGHPRLCWEAGGNGSGVTLEHCDRVLQGQQWSLTPNGVLMNGNGYCLEAVPGRPLFIDFAAQCAGTPGQTWHYRSSHLTSPVPGTTAASGTSATAPAPVPPPPARWCPAPRSSGAPAPSRLRLAWCPAGASATAPSPWRLAVAAARPAGLRRPGHRRQRRLRPGRLRRLRHPHPPPGVAASTLRATPGPSPTRHRPPRYVHLRHVNSHGLESGSSRPGSSVSGPSGSGLRCNVRTLSCTGTLPPGASRQITLTGPVPAAIRPGDSYPLRVHASVTGTAQRSRTARTTASVTVTVGPAAPQPRSPLPLIAGAAVLLLAGSLLILITRRTRTRTKSPSRHRAPASHRTPVGTHASAITQPLPVTRSPLNTPGPPHAQVDPSQPHQTPVS